jgi:anti-sigma B factor antagonist
MAITVRRHGDTTIIDLDGRLALGGPVDEFRARWSEELAAGNKNLILNLSTVTMVDSSGIGTMIRCHSAVTAAGGKLKVIGANGTVRKAFAVTRLDKVFEFHDSEASALA